MRSLILFLVLLFAAPAAAQNTPSVLDFPLGMSLPSAREMAPDLSGPPAQGQGQMLQTQRQFGLGGVDFPLRLVFLDGALDHLSGSVSLSTPTNEACFAKLQQVVSVLEERFGRLDAAEAEKRDTDLAPIRTSGGSYLRQYMPYGGSLTTIAKMRGSQSIETYATVSTTEKQQQLCFIYFGTGVAESSGELPQSTIENYTFLERPSRSDFEMSYPVSALISHRPGDVILICTVASDGKLDCRVGYEAGPGWGFGQAALRVAQKFRLPPQTSDGRSTTGATIRLPITFRAG